MTQLFAVLIVVRLLHRRFDIAVSRDGPLTKLIVVHRISIETITPGVQ